MPAFVFLWTDLFLFGMLAGAVLYTLHVRRTPMLRSAWRVVARTPSAMGAAVILALFLLVGLLDSVHYRPLLPPAAGLAPLQADAAAVARSGAAGGSDATEGEDAAGDPDVAGRQDGQDASGVASDADTASDDPPASGDATIPLPVYSPILRSVLDDMLAWLGLDRREATYSSPLAVRQFTKETRLVDGQPLRDFPRLKHAGAHLAHEADHQDDVRRRALVGVAWGLAVSLAMAALISVWRAWHGRRRDACQHGCDWLLGRTAFPWRAVWLTLSVLALALSLTAALGAHYHLLGTDRTGNDVLWMALKSIRTALVIGTLTTLAMLPPALFFGIAAGYFRGWVDDLIQYLYTTLTSIPGVLLVAACVLMMQVAIDTHPELFDSMAARADLRLFLLCLILGLTGWAGLCRMLRAETMKLRELEYVQAARAFGVGHWGIMRRHLLPNLMHIVLITLTLEFSGLVLYEAVLSYLGIGVDPSTPSFGTMIDAARLELSRDPAIWWNLAAAFAFLLTLVLSANLFADAVQTAFDPRRRPGQGQASS